MIAPSLNAVVDEALRLTRTDRRGRVWFDGYVLARRGDDALTRLRDAYYARLYTLGVDAAGAFRVFMPAAPVARPDRFEQALRRAAPGTAREAGWTFEGMVGASAVVVRHGLTLWVRPDEIEAAGHQSPRPGDPVTLRVAGTMPAVSPGYMMVLGATPLVVAGDDRLVRWYWHIVADGGPLLLGELANHGNAAKLPFSAKVLSAAADYTRCDSGVLYTRRSDLTRTYSLVGAVHRSVADHLRDAVPPWSKRLAFGLSVAEDPGAPGESFGQQRCRMLASAILAVDGERDPGRRKAAVLGALCSAGLALDKPHLRRAGDDPYRPLSRTVPRKKTAVDTIDGALEKIASRLCYDALRHEERCTWLSRLVTTDGSTRTLGGDLYVGVVGIAWFLAEFAARSGHRRARATALQAWNQTLAICGDFERPGHLSLYSGTLGVALAGAHIARALGSDLVESQARAIANDAWSEIQANGVTFESDLMTGIAGMIQASLALRVLWNEPRAKEVAACLGERLASTATVQDHGKGWFPLDRRWRRPLFGLSHGAAGIGMALAELAYHTDDARAAQLAQAAFAYEDASFDARRRNWPDARRTSPSFVTAWCHGAPGIVLSRLRANALLDRGGGGSPDVLLPAMATVHEEIRAHLASSARDWTLCHGVLGLAEVADFGTAAVAAGALVKATVDATLASFGSGELAVLDAADPTLMCGIAGTGMFLLRRADGRTPTPLAMGSVLQP